MTTPRIAKGLLAWYMRCCGFRGWASFWGAIYVLPGSECDEVEARAAELPPPRPPTP